MADEKKDMEEKKDLVEGNPNEVGFVETKAPVSSGDASQLEGLEGLPPIAPPGAKN